MEEEYDDIVRRWYEELKPLFLNYIHKNYDMEYDEIMSLYTDVWIAVRKNIRNGLVEPGTKWKSYILKIGWRQAYKRATRWPRFQSMDDETFDRDKFEWEYTEQKETEPSIYADPELRAVVAAELSYIPDPCNKILKLYYFDELSMTEIAESMNYSSSRSAITTKKRCVEKLHARVMNAVRRLGIL